MIHLSHLVGMSQIIGMLLRANDSFLSVTVLLSIPMDGNMFIVENKRGVS